MDEKEKRARYYLARTLGDLSESIIRRLPPFEQMELQPEVISYFYQKYIQYSDELEDTLRHKVLLMLIDYAKWEIKNTIMSGTRAFSSIYPEHVETENSFNDWIMQREGEPPSPDESAPPSSSKKIRINPIVKRIIKERFPDFKEGKIRNMPEIIPFAMDTLDGNRVYLIADKGIKRRALEFMIGIDYPRFYFNPSVFFSNSQALYRYHTEAEAAEAVGRALNLVELILPHVLEKVKEALDRYGSRQERVAQGE